MTGLTRARVEWRVIGLMAGLVGVWYGSELTVSLLLHWLQKFNWRPSSVSWCLGRGDDGVPGTRQGTLCIRARDAIATAYRIGWRN